MLVAATVMLLSGLYFTDVVTLRMGGAGAAAAAARARASSVAASKSMKKKKSDIESQKKESPEVLLHDD